MSSREFSANLFYIYLRNQVHLQVYKIKYIYRSIESNVIILFKTLICFFWIFYYIFWNFNNRVLKFCNFSWTVQRHIVVKIKVQSQLPDLFSAVWTINLSLNVNFLFQSFLVNTVFYLFNYLTIFALFDLANFKLFVSSLLHICINYINKK